MEPFYSKHVVVGRMSGEMLGIPPKALLINKGSHDPTPTNVPADVCFERGSWPALCSMATYYCSRSFRTTSGSSPMCLEQLPCTLSENASEEELNSLVDVLRSCGPLPA